MGRLKLLNLPLLTPLRHRDFALMWSGMFMNSVGSFMQQFGLGWLVVQLAVSEGHPERGALYLGFVAASRAVPAIVFGVIAGALADRVDRRRLLLRNQTWSVLVIVALTVLSAMGWLTLPLIIVTSVALAVTATLDGALRSSVITRLIPREILPSGIGIHLMGGNFAAIIGPLIGGVLITTVGITGLLGLNVLLGFPIFVALLAMRTELNDAAPAAQRPPLIGSIREGFGFVWRDPVFRPLFTLILFCALLARPYQQLLPAFAHEELHVGAIELSWLFGATGVGAVLGSVLTSIVGTRMRLGLSVVIAACAFGIAIFAFSLQSSIASAVLVMVAVGATHWTHAGLHVTTYQTRTPRHLIGRVIGASQMIPQSVMPIGALLFGALGSTIGVGPALGIGGLALSVVAGLILVTAPQLREHERANVAGEAVARP